MRTSFGRFMVSAILGTLLGVAAVPSAALEYDLEAHYRRLASVERLRGDAAGAAYLERLASGNPPAPPEITAQDRNAHPVYCEQYDLLVEGVRRGAAWADRENNDEYANRVAHAQAELDIVRYELSQAEMADPSVVREHLNRARVWLCYRYIALMAQAPPPPPPPPPSARQAMLPPPPPPPPPPPMTVALRVEPNVPRAGEPAALPIHLGRIHFDFDKSFIRADAVDTLAQVAAFLRAHPEASLILDGNCDWIGTTEYNQGLSERRAESTRRYLIQVHGIVPNRLATIGRSELNPIAPNEIRGLDYPEGRQQNRRVDILRDTE